MGNQGFRNVLIKRDYFEENSDFIKMLDGGNVDKQKERNYLFIEVQYKNNTLLVPLRRNLGNPCRPFGVIGFAVPCASRPLAGLDYRYILIVNDSEYLDFQERLDIPRPQRYIIADNYNQIELEVIQYVEGYIAYAIKNRATREPLYRESSLQNFNKELGILEGRILRQRELEAKKTQQINKKEKAI